MKTQTPIFTKQEITNKLNTLAGIYHQQITNKNRTEMRQKIEDINSQLKNIDEIENLDNEQLLDYGLELGLTIQSEEEILNKFKKTLDKDYKLCYDVSVESEKNKKEGKKMENIEEIKNLINTYDNMIEDLVNNNAPDKVVGDLELKRQKLIKQYENFKANNTSTIVEEKEEAQVINSEKIENIPTSREILRLINELDEINDKLSQSRIGIRRMTKTLFKIITSPDYFPGELPEEVKELYMIKNYKEKIEEKEQQVLREIGRFFKAKMTI